MTDFGDIELADTWDADPTIAPEQVAYFLHKLRIQVEALAGRTLVPFKQLPKRDRDRAMALAEDLARLVRQREPDNPAVFAELLVNANATRTKGKDWDRLTGPERQLVIDLLDLVIAWLEKEGPR